MHIKNLQHYNYMIAEYSGWDDGIDGTRCVLRTSSPRAGFSPTPSPPREKQTLEEEEGELEGSVLEKGTSDRVWKRSNLVHSKSGACAWHALLLGCYFRLIAQQRLELH